MRPASVPARDLAATTPGAKDAAALLGAPTVYSEFVAKVCAIVVLLAVTVSALWCVDGCVDPLSSRTSDASAPMPDQDESRSPCLCVVPFQIEPLGAADPSWRVMVADQAFALPDAPPAPSFDIDHPPRRAA